jgi:hypothetical protein
MPLPEEKPEFLDQPLVAFNGEWALGDEFFAPLPAEDPGYTQIWKDGAWERAGILPEIPAAPSDAGKMFAIQDGDWVEVATQKVFNFTQTTPATTWTIVHNLNNKKPSIDLVNGSGETITGAVDTEGATLTTLVVYFAVAVSGSAKLIG